MKKNLAIIMALTGIVIAGFVFWGLRQPQAPVQDSNVADNSGDSSADIIFYYGKECSHCQNVEKFIADNKIDERVSFAKKEVWHNVGNSTEMQDKVKQCALNPDQVGVPFLYARGKCYIGEIDVEDFFKKEAGIQ